MKKLIILFLSVVFTFSAVSQRKLPKEIDENARELIHNGIIWNYGYSADNVYMLNYNHENSYKENGEIRFNMMVYKLDYEKSEFVPASEPIDYVSMSEWSNKSIVCGYKLIKSHRNKKEYLNGNSSVKLLNNGFLLLTYKKYNLRDKSKTYNTIVLLKYNHGDWIIKRKLKFKTKDAFKIDQYYYNPETDERKYMVHNNDVRIKFVVYGKTYKHIFEKGEFLRK